MLLRVSWNHLRLYVEMVKMRARFLAFISLALGACASTEIDHQEFRDAVEKGECNRAEAIARPYAQSGNAVAVNDIGVVYDNCFRDTQRAAGYYTLAARMGDNTARMNLTRLGLSVPAPDLAQHESSNASQILMMIDAATPARARSISCTSFNAAGITTTNCQ